MKLHIPGICGTFMGGLALLARALGHEVEGSDQAVYPPMSDQLAAAGIRLHEGYDAACLDPPPDQVIVGNALSRGNPAVEYLLDSRLPHISGPAWLAEHVLRNRHVIAISGTHGKTTTASMLAWLLAEAGLEPGFLIGGVPADFGVSARLGQGRVFVIEADEYDSAFFDKRSKFIHYRPDTLVINNLEFDHADIFRDMEDIRRQFNHLIRTVSGRGLILARAADPEIDTVLGRGCWTPVQRFGIDEGDWQAHILDAAGCHFEVLRAGHSECTIAWNLLGRHNVENGLAALAAAAAAGVQPRQAAAALASFRGVKRRLERLAEIGGITVYDDFAHHPTAIRSTLDGLRARVGGQRILAVLEPRSNTMRLGVHNNDLAAALASADRVWLYQPPDLGWDPHAALAPLAERSEIHTSVEAIVEALAGAARPGDHILIMSNGGFDDIHQRLRRRLAT